MTEHLLISARWYARHGIAVFPLHYPVDDGKGALRCTCGSPHVKADGTSDGNPATHPYARHAPRGFQNATTDLRQIEAWWRPGVPYNIGIATGAVSGIVVVDVDPRHGGDETLMGLELQHGMLPETRRHLTGSLGLHIFFRHPGVPIRNNVSTKLGPGLDVRGDGGYVVAPPSRYISGRHYESLSDDDAPLADLPAWLQAMLVETARPRYRPARTPAGWRKIIADGVTEGQRNDAIARLSGLLLRPGPKDPFVVTDLLRCWNA